MDVLDLKLLEHFDGNVVRKDLLHRIKKGTNVPTFVLEFLLARYCASDEPAEIQAGLEVVLATLQDNYVRPDEANASRCSIPTGRQTMRPSRSTWPTPWRAGAGSRSR
jgi:ATP-dependent Lon protease